MHKMIEYVTVRLVSFPLGSYASGPQLLKWTLACMVPATQKMLNRNLNKQTWIREIVSHLPKNYPFIKNTTKLQICSIFHPLFTMCIRCQPKRQNYPYKIATTIICVCF